MPDYKNIAVVKTIEELAEHLAKNEKLILDCFIPGDKEYRFILHVFNNFRGVYFTHHDYIYVEMSWWNYFIKYRKFCKHFNIKRIKYSNNSSNIDKFSIYPVLSKIYKNMEENFADNLTYDYDKLFSEAYDDFYAEGDKKFVRYLY